MMYISLECIFLWPERRLMKESVPYFNTRDLLSEVLESAIGLNSIYS